MLACFFWLLFLLLQLFEFAEVFNLLLILLCPSFFTLSGHESATGNAFDGVVTPSGELGSFCGLWVIHKHLFQGVNLTPINMKILGVDISKASISACLLLEK